MHQSIVTTAPPLGPGNSGDFDFRSSQSRVQSPPCGDTRLVKSPQIAPATPGDIQAKAHSKEINVYII